MDTTIAVAGIDVSKAKLDVCMPNGDAFVVSRDKRGLATLRKHCRQATVSHIAMEASGGYEQDVLDALEHGDWQLRLLNPGRVRRFAQAAGMLAKDDPLDARMIRGYPQTFPDAGLARKSPQDRQLSEFLCVRAMLRRALDDARNQLEHLRDAKLRKLVGTWRSGLQEQLDGIDADIA